MNHSFSKSHLDKSANPDDAVEACALSTQSASLQVAPSREVLSFEEIYDKHLAFVWKQLQRFGIQKSDLEDACQEVFIAVHTHLPTYDVTRPFTPWLYGLCMNTASKFQDKAYRRYERPSLLSECTQIELKTPEVILQSSEEKVILGTLIDKLDIEKRSAFVMFEFEGLSCDQISELTGAPKGTVHSRLYHARKEIALGLKRLEHADDLFLNPSSLEHLPTLNTSPSPKQEEEELEQNVNSHQKETS